MVTTSKKTQKSSQTEKATSRLAPCSNWSEMSASEHFVQYYESEVVLLDSLSGFIGTGLSVGDACIVIATKAHRERLEEQMKKNYI